MGEILGIGMTHFPRLVGPDSMMADSFTRVLHDPALDDTHRDPSTWPELLRQEYGDDNGEAAAGEHRAALVEGLRRVRAAIDDFAPDLLIVWGDDQYENFREDCIPPYAVLAYDKTTSHPWRKLARFGSNVWGEHEDTTVEVMGHRRVAKTLTEGLLRNGIDVTYAYEPLHEDGLSHAFLNTVLFLDYDRNGFPYPVVPIAINCYGRKVISQRGGLPRLGDPPDEYDPPSPAPWRCFELGAACARTLGDTELRVALVASASWSHGFLTEKNRCLYPDMDADRRLYKALEEADYATWRDTTLESIEDSGQQEMLNWMALMGAMNELDATPAWTTFVETCAFNSNKAFAVFTP